MRLYFSDFFEVRPTDLKRYGAFNISLVSDLPLFIDPFLLFNSRRPVYRGPPEAGKQRGGFPPPMIGEEENSRPKFQPRGAPGSNNACLIEDRSVSVLAGFGK